MKANSLPDEFKDRVVLEIGCVAQSPSYLKVIEFAQRMNEYWEAGEGKNKKHYVPLVETEGKQWLELYDLIRNWKTSRVHFNTIEAPTNYNGGIFRCYLARLNSGNLDEHCFDNNWIGCQLVREGHSLELFARTGKFENGMDFKPDKEVIKKRIENSHYELGLCPAYKFNRLTDSINNLPEIINYETDDKWQPILEGDASVEGIRVIGIQYNTENIYAEAPVISDTDDLEKFSVRNRGFLQEYHEVWEHHIVILSKERYKEEVSIGSIKEISELGKKGWLIIAVNQVANEWHFFLQRKQPY